MIYNFFSLFSGISQHQILGLSRHYSNQLAIATINVGEEYFDATEAANRVQEQTIQSQNTLEYVKEGIF